MNYNYELPDAFIGWYNMLDEKCKARITTKEWRDILLNHRDQIVKKGVIRKMQGKYMGAGVYEITLEPLKE